MNNFNKLYNLILQSVITQNKAQRVAMIQKCNFLLDADKKKWIHFFDNLNNNKLADFLCKYVANRQLDNVFDSRIQRVKKILELNPSIDTQNFKGELSQFVLQHLDILKKHQQKEMSKTLKGLDAIPELSQKKVYKNGVVIYRVKQSFEGLLAVRKIVDAQWGVDANPWCLIARDQQHGLTNATRYWNQYKAYPKHIAFQNGKLLAFSANDDRLTRWWDRNDKPSSKLKLLDGTQMKIPKFQWDNDYKLKRFLKKCEEKDDSKLIYNEQTGLYDVQGTIVIQNEDIIDQHLPVKFGKVTEGFYCYFCRSLTSLEGAPKWVGKHFDCSCDPNLKSLVGAPEYVGGDFCCRDCNKLVNLIGAPKKVGRSFHCGGGKKLISLQGAPEEVGQNFTCRQSPELKTLKGAPKKVGRNFDCGSCEKLQSLIGAPKRVENIFECWSCSSLKTFQGGPQYVGSKFEAGWCKSLINLKGAPRIIKGYLNLACSQNLQSLQGGPDEVAWISVYDCPKVKITAKDRQKYKLTHV